MVTEEEHHNIAEEMRQIRAQLPEDEIQEMNEENRQRRSDLPINQ
jgi:hypothetical protein